MKLKLYALLLAAVASVSSAGLASAAPAVPDRLYFPNDRGTGWIYIDNDNTQVPRFSKDKIGNVTSFSMHAYSETAGSKLFFFIANSQKDSFGGYTGASDCLYTVSGDSWDGTSNKVLAAGKYTAYRYGSLKHCHELPAGEYAIDMEFDSSRSDDGISMEIFDCNATPDNLYFTANMGNGWHYADAPAFTKSGKVFTYTVEADKQFYFFINRKRRSSWEAMTEANSSSAYGINGDKHLGGDRTIDGTEFDMSLYGTMTRCFTITSPGKYTFKMDFTNGRPHLTITKEGGDDPILMDTAMPAKYTGVILQGFYWDSYDDTAWKNLEKLAYDYSNYFELVWVPNSGKASAEKSMGYDPVYWYTNHNSAFGTEDELFSMNGLYNDLNTNMIEDVVVNHRGGATNWTDFPEEVDHNGTTWTWNPSHICSTDEVKDQADQAKPTGNPDTGDDFNAYRDLDHTNTYVQDGIKAYLNTLHEKYGYNGWRFDMVKGYGAKYVGDYVRSAGMKYAVGEYWDSFDPIVNWITGTGLASAAFDFPFKFALNDAMNGNEDLTKVSWTYEKKAQPAGLIHHEVYKRYGVTFVDNHDTYRNNNRFKNENLVVAANALMLCSPGTPCVFLRHYLDHMDAINRLIDIRKAVGIHNQSEVEMLKLESNCYVARVKGLYGSLVVKVGSDMSYNCTDAGYTMVAAGNADDNNYCVWANVPIYDHITLTPDHKPGDYKVSSPFKLNFEYTNVPEGAYLVYTTDGKYPTPNYGTRVNLAANRQAKAPARVNLAGTAAANDELNLWIDKPENHVMAAVFTKDDRPYSPLFDGTYTLPGDLTGINGIDAESDGLNVAYNASTRTLEGFDADRARVEVFSTMGTLVATTPSLTELPAGIYIYRVSIDGNTATGRLRL